MLTLEQRALRKTGIGGSDAAAICGISRWKTPMDVYFDKLSTDEEIDVPNEAMERGTTLEPFVFELLREKYNLKWMRSEKTWIHPDHPFILANIDGILKDGSKILEIKTSCYREGWGDVFTDQIPNEYLAQVHHYMNVTGVEEAVVAVLFGDRSFLNLLARMVQSEGEIRTIQAIHDLDFDLRVYIVKRNEKLGAAILKKEVTFWTENVLKRVDPPVHTIDDLKLLFPSPVRSEVEADEESIRLVEAIKRREEEIKAIEAENEQAKKDLAAKIGEYETLISMTGDILATWKSQSRKTLDTKALHLQMPQIYEQFVITKPLRILRVR